jgi:hypothetical protein
MIRVAQPPIPKEERTSNGVWPSRLRNIVMCEIFPFGPGRKRVGDPIWFGARSFQTSLFICLDVDADRSPQQILAKKYPEWEQMPDDLYAIELNKIASHLARQIPRPSFADRCIQVERAFRRMGINPDNPTSVLIQPTPSGGRHYFVFFDAPYLLSQYHQLLRAAKLQHVPGEIEFYPSTKHGLRLPFGYIPGQPYNPQAWIQFIDDYRNGKIIRHSLADCNDSLEKHTEIQSRRIQSVKESRPGTPTEPTRDPNQGADAESRYRSLLEGIHCSMDAEDLMSLGILLPGTRTQVLNHLAAHLIWFKHLSATDAADLLIDWAMSSRHASKDIQEDLATGTTKVAKHIQTMCRWYESNRQTPDIPVNAYATAEFAPQELKALRYRLADLSPDDRAHQAQFLLNFLRFAKHHGSADSDGTGWLASPARGTRWANSSLAASSNSNFCPITTWNQRSRSRSTRNIFSSAPPAMKGWAMQIGRRHCSALE